MEQVINHKIKIIDQNIISIFNFSGADLQEAIQENKHGLFVNLYEDSFKEVKALRFGVSSTSCNLGGKRYWFVCPNKACNKRIAKLYQNKKNLKYTCRNCMNLTYVSKFKNPTERRFPYTANYSQYRLDQMEQEIHRKYYGGNMTKKYSRYVKIKNEREKEFEFLINNLTKYGNRRNRS